MVAQENNQYSIEGDASQPISDVPWQAHGLI